MKQKDFIKNVMVIDDNDWLEFKDNGHLIGKIKNHVGYIITVSTRHGDIVFKNHKPTKFSVNSTVRLKYDEVENDIYLDETYQSNLNTSHVKPLPNPYMKTVIKPSFLERVSSHKSSSDAQLSRSLSNYQKDNAFDIARTLCLLPNTDSLTQFIMNLSFVIATLTKSTTNNWSGYPRNIDNANIANIFKKRNVILPGLGEWTVIQIPINHNDINRWIILSIPTDTLGLVSRFMMEIPTDKFGLIQLKVMGQGNECEIHITTADILPDDVTNNITESAHAVAQEIQSSIQILYFNNSSNMVDFTIARSTNIEA